MGMVVDGGDSIVVRNDDVIRHTGIEEADFAAACRFERAGAPPVSHSRDCAEIVGRMVIVIDDVVTTAQPPRAALRHASTPSEAPCACGAGSPTDALAEEALDEVCLEHHAIVGALGDYCRDFRQISDSEVIEILARFRGTSLAGGVKPRRPRRCNDSRPCARC
jgi:predicted phosphoribosyltransferase